MVDLSQLCSFNAQKLPKIKKVALFQKLLPELLDVFMWTLLKVLLFVLHSDFQHRSINVARTLSEKTNYHNNTIFRNNKLADNMWKIREYFRFLLFLRRDWGLRPRAFICFLVFGNPDETLALVFEIVLETELLRAAR